VADKLFNLAHAVLHSRFVHFVEGQPPPRETVGVRGVNSAMSESGPSNYVGSVWP
jgi:hypothetical protein